MGISLMAKRVAEAMRTPQVCVLSLKEHLKLDLSFVIREDNLRDGLNTFIHHVINLHDL